MRHLLIPLTGALVAFAVAGCTTQQTRGTAFTSLQAERTQFTRMDNNDDGYLTARELNPDLRLSREFDAWDRNGDGRISFDEFNAYVAEVMS